MPTLHDGREVADDSFDWLLETLAGWVLALQPKARRQKWLAEFEEKSPRLAPELKERMLAIWRAGKRQNAAGVTKTVTSRDPEVTESVTVPSIQSPGRPGMELAACAEGSLNSRRRRT